MPYGVTQWGYSPDPRTVAFALVGFNFGQLPPWRWVMKTTDARFPYQSLNDGVTWERSSNTDDEAAYIPVTPIPNVNGAFMSFRGVEVPSGGVTIEWFCGFFMTGDPFQTEGFLFELFPDALQTRSFQMIGGDIGGRWIPEPLVITPHKWNAP